mmetsp:Transcript_152968/g.285029  ORF Transcript_152968/g.285029 Transcript_152968/m.285029 type:complete len:249 (-) Transcript_152968:68-814(-)
MRILLKKRSKVVYVIWVVCNVNRWNPLEDMRLAFAFEGLQQSLSSLSSCLQGLDGHDRAVLVLEEARHRVILVDPHSCIHALKILRSESPGFSEVHVFKALAVPNCDISTNCICTDSFQFVLMLFSPSQEGHLGTVIVIKQVNVKLLQEVARLQKRGASTGQVAAMHLRFFFNQSSILILPGNSAWPLMHYPAGLHERLCLHVRGSRRLTPFSACRTCVCRWFNICAGYKWHSKQKQQPCDDKCRHRC